MLFFFMVFNFCIIFLIILRFFEWYFLFFGDILNM